MRRSRDWEGCAGPRGGWGGWPAATQEASRVWEGGCRAPRRLGRGAARQFFSSSASKRAATSEFFLSPCTRAEDGGPRRSGDLRILATIFFGLARADPTTGGRAPLVVEARAARASAHPGLDADLRHQKDDAALPDVLCELLKRVGLRAIPAGAAAGEGVDRGRDGAAEASQYREPS